jgi:hypothetical protein
MLVSEGLESYLAWQALELEGSAQYEVLLSHQEPTTLLHGQTTCQERIGHRESSIV